MNLATCDDPGRNSGYKECRPRHAGRESESLRSAVGGVSGAVPADVGAMTFYAMSGVG